jgi:hypothetical protein
VTAVAIAAGVLVALVLFLLGALNLGTCNGSLALGFFGGGMIVLALTSVSIGGVPVGVGAGILGVILIVVGFLVQNGATCAFGL